MRTIYGRTISAAAMMAVAASAIAPAAAVQVKEAAPIAVASGTVMLRATATYSDGTSADRLYKVTMDADSDGDGVGDEVWLRVRCADGAVAAVHAHHVKSPRDSASGMASGKMAAQTGVSPRDPATGMATGKRQHKPFRITMELDRTAIIGQRVSWDLKENKGARMASEGKTMGADDWHQRSLRDGAANLCV